MQYNISFPGSYVRFCHIFVAEQATLSQSHLHNLQDYTIPSFGANGAIRTPEYCIVGTQRHMMRNMTTASGLSHVRISPQRPTSSILFHKTNAWAGKG